MSVACLQLITTTGARPRAWELCQLWMSRQTYTGTVEWVVVDDAEEPSALSVALPENWGVRRVRPLPYWHPGQNTQVRNLQAAMAQIDATLPAVFIEDDDYYGPGWLSAVARALSDYELVGESFARYYNVASHRYKMMSNAHHSSLCSTALRGAGALQALRSALALNAKFVDIDLWRQFAGSKLLMQPRHVVGIKGLPGRPGIGVGHADYFGISDIDCEILRAWCGDDAEVYL